MKRLFLCVLIAFAAAFQLPAENDVTAALQEGFANPPRDARPRVWWHWMNGNITRDGIRKDIEWMDRAGVGGFHVFDAGLQTPQIVEKRLAYMTPEWKDAFNYALDLAVEHDMEVTIASSPGWSVTGGPWVSREDAMKTLNWREITVRGGRRYRGPLPDGYEVCGKYLNHHLYSDDPHRYDFYRDIAVLAVKLPDDDLSMEEMGAVITTSGGDDASILHDSDILAPCKVNPGTDGYASIQIEFPEPRTICAYTTYSPDDFNTRPVVLFECSDDGIVFRPVGSSLIGKPRTPYTVPYLTLDVDPTEARYFRFRESVPGRMLEMTEIQLHAVTRVNASHEKAGFFTFEGTCEYYRTPATDDAVSTGDVIDITDRFKDGILDWKVPAGRWKIFRFGYNLRGKHNTPASPEATGLEVDKLDREAVRRYYRKYLEMYDDASGGRLGTALTHLMIDSFEAGSQTWTPRMREEFAARRGYDLLPWMPALTGMVIGSSDQTEQFLEDWRLTLGELMAQNHYDSVDEILKEYGMKRHTESHEAGRAYVVDGMDVKRNADIPMSAFWMTYPYASYENSDADIRESASVCHIYGQELCAAESFTVHGGRPGNDGLLSGWSYYPARLKPAADAAMADGLTRFVIHCSTHQPVDDKVPGLGLGPYGQWFHRHETWAEEARPWTDYLARSTWMLRQGRYAAEIAYLYGENTNITARFHHDIPFIPEGYSYDFVNRTALLEALRIEGNELVAPSGVRYRALIIDAEVESMSVELLRCIDRIADAGILIAGSEPQYRAGLGGSGNEFVSLVRSIWHSGRRNVCSLGFMKEKLRQAGICPSVVFANPDGADIRFVHRRLDDGAELFWVANIAPEGRTVEFSFDVTGRKPLVFHAETGLTEEVSYRMEGGRTVVPLQFVRDDAQFVVFAEKTDVDGFCAEKPRIASETELTGSWSVSFQSGRGAPENAVFGHLSSYTEIDEPGIKYFSGKAVFGKSIELHPAFGGRVVLDLGKVCHMARVYVNGEDMGLVWKEPYALDITAAVREGANDLRVEVINSWANRLIGDLQPGVTAPVTYVAVKHFDKNSSLRESGLLGPVRVMEFL